jgi:hypothetical protein
VNEWTYRGKLFNDDIAELIGFVYILTNTVTGKKYLGKKLFWFSGKKKIKGKKRRVKTITESDWREYHGSSDAVKADIEKLGNKAFTREILHLCKSKAECSYLELHEQIVQRALIRDDFYNSWIRVRVTRNHLKNLECLKDVGQ